MNNPDDLREQLGLPSNPIPMVVTAIVLAGIIGTVLFKFVF